LYIIISEDQISLTDVEDDNDGDDTMISGRRYRGKLKNRNDISNSYKKANNIQADVSLYKYQSLSLSNLVLAASRICFFVHDTSKLFEADYKLQLQ
jgi:hypothetical protein